MFSDPGPLRLVIDLGAAILVAEIAAFSDTIEELSKFTNKANSIVDKFIKSDENWFYKTLMKLVK